AGRARARAEDVAAAVPQSPRPLADVVATALPHHPRLVGGPIPCSIVLAVRESPNLQEIRGLDPALDHARIVYLDTCFEFPWDTTRALELALFRTFAVPSVAALLDSTGEFKRAPQKRYDDTDLILSTIVEAGYDSEDGKRAIRRMNRIHGRFEITNEDFLYVLSSFVFEPIRWNTRFGWRPLIETEKLATFEYWRAVGRRM